MQEIIEQLDKADQDIRKKLSEQTCGLGDARKKEISSETLGTPQALEDKAVDLG